MQKIRVFKHGLLVFSVVKVDKFAVSCCWQPAECSPIGGVFYYCVIGTFKLGGKESLGAWQAYLTIRRLLRPIEHCRLLEASTAQTVSYE